MTDLFIVHGVWAHLDEPGHEDDWDVWITDSEKEAQRIADSIGPGFGTPVHVRKLVPSVYFDAQYAWNPHFGDDWEGYVGPRFDDEETRKVVEAAAVPGKPSLPRPQRRPEQAPRWVRETDSET